MHDQSIAELSKKVGVIITDTPEHVLVTQYFSMKNTLVRDAVVIFMVVFSICVVFVVTAGFQWLTMLLLALGLPLMGYSFYMVLRMARDFLRVSPGHISYKYRLRQKEISYTADTVLNLDFYEEALRGKYNNHYYFTVHITVKSGEKHEKVFSVYTDAKYRNEALYVASYVLHLIKSKGLQPQH